MPIRIGKLTATDPDPARRQVAGLAKLAQRETVEHCMVSDAYARIRAEFGTVQILEKPEKVRKVQQKLAPKMGGDEQPLFAGDGYDLLVTDKSVYGGQALAPMRLEDILLVAPSRINVLDFVFKQGVPTTELLINGRRFVSTYVFVMPIKFLVRVLEALGEERRKEIGKSPHAIQMEYWQPPLMCAAGVCSRRDEGILLEKLKLGGIAEDDAMRMVNFMQTEFRQPERLSGLVMLISGLAIFGVPFLLILAMQLAGARFVVVLKCVAVLGALLAIAGLFKFITGYRGLTESHLDTWWRGYEKARTQELTLEESQP